MDDYFVWNSCVFNKKKESIMKWIVGSKYNYNGKTQQSYNGKCYHWKPDAVTEVPLNLFCFLRNSDPRRWEMIYVKDLDVKDYTGDFPATGMLISKDPNAIREIVSFRQNDQVVKTKLEDAVKVQIEADLTEAFSEPKEVKKRGPGRPAVNKGE